MSGECGDSRGHDLRGDLGLEPADIQQSQHYREPRAASAPDTVRHGRLLAGRPVVLDDAEEGPRAAAFSLDVRPRPQAGTVMPRSRLGRQPFLGFLPSLVCR